MPQQAGICRTIFVFKPRRVLYNILINTAGHAVREKEQTGQEALPVLRRKRGGIMEHLLFYYGSWFMGVICFISTLAVYRSNKRILRDLKNPWETKNKWLINFVQEHQKLLKENAEIHNPSVYVIRRMRGRKIGPWNIRQVKGISWGALFLSFSLWQFRRRCASGIRLPRSACLSLENRLP